MRKTITRTMVVSTISAVQIAVVEGKVEMKELEPITAFGKITEKNALKEVKEIHGEGTFTITKIETKETAYEMEIETFIKHAKEITVEQAKENNR